MDVGPLMFIGVPVVKKHKGEIGSIRHPHDHLAIYHLGQTKNVEQKRPVKSQFGEFGLDFFRGEYLCVPSEKLHWKEMPGDGR